MATYGSPNPGVGAVGQYQISAQPYVTGAFIVPKSGDPAIEITFPRVTQWVYLQNMGAVASRVGFSLLGTTGSLDSEDAAQPGSDNYFWLPASDATNPLPILRMRVKSLFFVSSIAQANADVVVVAGLTGIHSPLPGPEGNNYSGSAGIG